MAEWETTTSILLGLRDFDNREAWERLDVHFRAAIVRFALRLGIDPGDANDVAQETLLGFAEAYRAGRYDRDRGRLRDWLFGIAGHKARSVRRKQAHRRLRALSASDDDVADDDPPPDELLLAIWEEEHDRLLFERALQQLRQDLDATTFGIFEQVGLHGRPGADVAAEFGVSRNAVYLAKRRVLERLRDLVRLYEARP